MGVGPHYCCRVALEAGAFLTRDHYANTADPDGTGHDELTLRGHTAALQLARYTLNQKHYATAGRQLEATLRGVRGTATYVSGPGAAATASAER